MAENSQLSDETKNNSTDNSSTDASSAVIGNHENAVVPHKISNHDKLVQTSVMVDGEWINVNDTNDQANMKEDMHKVNKKVVEAQKGIVEAKNSAESAVKYADSAVSASKVNSDAIVAQSSAISEAKAAADDAASKAQAVKENASSEAAAIRNQVADVANNISSVKADVANNVSSVKADVASAASDVANLKVDVQANSAAIIKTNEAVSVQSKNSSDAINELKIANGQVESIAKDAKNNATVAKQSADAATTLAQDAKSNAVLATQTATSATVEATNASSAATKAELSVNGLTTRVTAVEGDNKKLSNQIVSTETILQQTKDQLLQKADKSIVDQANNLISQLSAEQKIMAGQISQKVSSSEYQTLKDKVNGMKIGGRNYILNSAKKVFYPVGQDNYDLCWDVSKEAFNVNPDKNGQYKTHFSFDMQASSALPIARTWQIYWRTYPWTSFGMITYPANTTNVQHYELKITTPATQPIADEIFIRFMKEDTGKPSYTITNSLLTISDVFEDYSPNPDDTIAIINKNTTAIDENSKAIKLKADATEVNNLKGTVNSHSASINLFSDQLLQKADKSIVDQANNLISQLSAEQKIMAGQISQKVSSSEYQTLKDKVNNLQAGGENLIQDGDANAFGATPWPNTLLQNHDFYFNGTKKMFNLHTASKTELVADNAKWFPVVPGHQYTLSFKGFMSVNVSSYDVWLLGKKADAQGGWTDTFRIVNGERLSSAHTDTITKTTTVPSFWNNYVAYIRFDNNGSTDGQDSVFFFNEVSFKEGNIDTGYSPSPYDAIASIKKNSTAIDGNSKLISLMAKQTDVDNIKGTVNSHSASINLFSDQLKSMVTESKVNDIINGKGFTTQSTVQSLIDQKAGTLNESITKLDSKIDESGGGINLQGGTADCSFPIGSNGPRITIENYDDHTKMIHAVGSKSGFYIGYDKGRFIPEVGETYTFSADIKGKGTINGDLFKYEGADSSSMSSITLNNNWQRIKTTVHVSQLSGTWIIYPNPDNGNNDFYVKNIKIERGSIATPYSQAPSDNASVSQLQSVTASIDGLQSAVKNKVDQSQYTQLAGIVQTKVSQSDFNRLNSQVNVQTLDSANIDNMKTTGHYFVHNLTGNPIGGWVYVDVTGNANDRIRQDVYQDNGTKHAFRRWFGTYWTGWSTGAEESEITQLRSDINLRVKSGDLLSQINIAAGHTLIQSNKIYFDADSFVMSPNSKAFIPSAYITNINADKITTGTLDAAKFNVRNFSADNITGGTLNGVVVKTGANDRYFQTSKDNIYWVRNGSMSLVGNDIYLNSANGLNIADEKNIQLTTWGGATVNKDGSITNNSGNYGHPKIVIDREGNFNPDDPYGAPFAGGPGDSEIVQWVGNKEYTALTRGKGFTVHLNGGNNKSTFTIQKDNKVGFYVGGGDDGGEIRIAGAGPIKLQGKYIDDGFNDGMTHTLGNLQVDNLHVRKWLGVDQSKNAIVKTSQGPVTINAYETAEYYFGDIGEGQTSADGIAYIGIEKLFNETVNTTIPYHVFITAYGPGNIWVDQREHNRFIVKSDQPNLKFSWEIKAKRKGYEHTRLQNVNDKLNHMAATS